MYNFQYNNHYLNFSDIPIEIQSKILLSLNQLEQIKVCTVCQEWYDIIFNDASNITNMSELRDACISCNYISLIELDKANRFDEIVIQNEHNITINKILNETYCYTKNLCVCKYLIEHGATMWNGHIIDIPYKLRYICDMNKIDSELSIINKSIKCINIILHSSFKDNIKRGMTGELSYLMVKFSIYPAPFNEMCEFRYTSCGDMNTILDDDVDNKPITFTLSMILGENPQHANIFNRPSTISSGRLSKVCRPCHSEIKTEWKKIFNIKYPKILFDLILNKYKQL